LSFLRFDLSLFLDTFLFLMLAGCDTWCVTFLDCCLFGLATICSLLSGLNSVKMFLDLEFLDAAILGLFLSLVLTGFSDLEFFKFLNLSFLDESELSFLINSNYNTVNAAKIIENIKR